MKRRVPDEDRSPARARAGDHPGGAAGFSLVEVVIVTLISVVVLGALYAGALVSRKSYAFTDSSVRVQEGIRRAFSTMLAELRESVNVNNNVSIANPGVQRLDFQLSRGYDAAACSGVCQGSDDPAWPTGWVHYLVDTTTPQRVRLMRCVTANRLDTMPANFNGCRVLANDVSSALTDSAFRYDSATRVITVQLPTSVTSQDLPNGRMVASPAPLVMRVRLRNTS